METASIWFNELARSQEAPSKQHTQLPISELCVFENELLSWLTKHDIQARTEILQILLQVGLRLYDLETLEQRIANSNVFPNMWSFLEFMLVTETMLNELDSDLKQVSVLIEAMNTCSYIEQKFEQDEISS